MIRVTVLYPYDGGTRFDHDYYATKHLALVKEVMGDALKSVEFVRGISDPDGNPPAYIAIANLLYGSKEDYLERRTASRPRIVADAPNFTDYKPITVISEVTASEDLAG